jgi:tellurite resistance protein
MKVPSPHEALIYLMVVTSASDRDMTDDELARIGEVVRTWPIFDGFEDNELLPAAQRCQKLLQEQQDGLGTVLSLVRDVLPSHVRDTAYAMAFEVAAADLEMHLAERHILKRVAAALELPSATVAAIELAAKARLRLLT